MFGWGGLSRCHGGMYGLGYMGGKSQDRKKSPETVEERGQQINYAMYRRERVRRCAVAIVRDGPYVRSGGDDTTTEREFGERSGKGPRANGGSKQETDDVMIEDKIGRSKDSDIRW